MKLKSALFPFFILLVLLTLNCGKKLHFSMVTSTSMENGLPFLVLGGKEWKAEPGAEFVKLHFYADNPFALSKVSIESCSGKFKDRIAAYVNFDEVYASTDVQNSNSEVIFDPVVQARSVTLNFQRNQNICIKSVKFFDEKKSAYRTYTPEIVSGTVTASETASPEPTYSVMNLFDSKYENGYSSVKGGVGVTFNFDFSEKKKISVLKIWNGYQRSDVHCIKNGRVKSLLLTGDDGYSAKVELEDVMGSQDIQLPTPFKGKKLTIKVDEIYPGLTEKGIVLSELRFGDDGEWFAMDTLPKSKDTAAKNFDAFAKASLRKVLNRGLTGREVSEVIDETISDLPVGAENEVSVEENLDPPTSSDWTIRLRSDGTFFLEGSTARTNYDAGEESSNRFYGMGNYEIKDISPGKIQMRIFGFLRKQTFTNFLDYGGGDCNGCGRDCNLVKNPDPNNTEKIFQEFVTLQMRGKQFYLTNAKKTENLDFSTLELNLE
ncbi:NADase-type glycan-binding domain-containing protein [Leptospira bandrabouensis]|uniref:NADase-type glycan-binding domain-containing protein n=1 Tax=Leptospira bandrabouensis TaxID=2484903 RepID=UPI001EEBB9FB|nr:hypothetical protein [Leptospira bandrabouensis]MCG6153674.1 hypothetical protein [Leptospira bandrabouensis]MCW7458549.1 hypothetical protein [Leptospira bandrabouensis]MCW7478704.1 hypothetical protein [Leptospira bandrabouensis]MCW7486632.1 hypothetical protein [Leptospira bandrabouensis]